MVVHDGRVTFYYILAIATQEKRGEIVRALGIRRAVQDGDGIELRVRQVASDAGLLPYLKPALLFLTRRRLYSMNCNR
jgi:hypothetical protein